MAGTKIAFQGGEVHMKKLAIGLLFASGILLAQDAPPPDQPPQPRHMSELQKEALRTQSPPVHVSKKYRENDLGYRVTENKTTIVVTVPYGK
jgi:hypothetical protein